MYAPGGWGVWSELRIMERQVAFRRRWTALLPVPIALSIAHRGFLNGTAESRERVRQAHDVTHMMVGYNVTFCEITENVH